MYVNLIWKKRDNVLYANQDNLEIHVLQFREMYWY